MISFEEAKREIDSALQLQNIAQAMEQSAASYILKTRSQILKTRSFFDEAWKSYDIVRRLSLPHKNFTKSSLVISITPNQGMYGNLLIEEFDRVMEELKGTKSDLIIVGKKGRAILSRNITNTTHFFELPEEVNYETINPIVELVSKFTKIKIVYPKYISAFEQEIFVISLNDQLESISQVAPDEIELKRFQLDPNIEAIAQYFDKTVVGLIFFRHFLESMLAYKAAEMISMKRAYDNAVKFLAETKGWYFRLKRESIDCSLRELSASRNLWEEE